MNKTRKIISAALAGAALLTATGCNGGGERAGNDNTTTQAVTTTTIATTTLETDKAVQDAAGNAAENLDTAIEKVDKKIKWLSWYDIDETQAAVEIFKAKYGVPEEGSTAYGADFANDVFAWENVAYGDRYDKLGKLVAAGDSPDMFPFEIDYFPLSAYMNMFQTIDGVVDTTTEDWSQYRDIMDKFTWGGKNWCAITEIKMDYVLWYRTSIIEELGLEDPYELYQNGEWTWDKFMEMADKFQNSGEDRFAIDGWRAADHIEATTGVPIVSIENGKLKGNLYDPAVERAAAFIEKIAAEDYRYPWHLRGFSTNLRGWYNGEILFFSDGTALYETESTASIKKRYGWDNDELFFVPFPRDPAADQYYHAMKQTAYMLVSGAPNVDGFAAWTDCVLAASKDENVKQAQREKSKNDFGWTDKQLDFLAELESSLVPVWEFKCGVDVLLGNDNVVVDGSVGSPTRTLLWIPYSFAGETYTQTRAEWESIINGAIDEANLKA